MTEHTVQSRPSTQYKTVGFCLDMYRRQKILESRMSVKTVKVWDEPGDSEVHVTLSDDRQHWPEFH